MLIRRVPAWSLPERDVTPEDLFRSRRTFIRNAAIAAGAIVSGACSPTAVSRGRAEGLEIRDTIPAPSPPFPAPRNGTYTADRPLTDEVVAATYNNFYEFTTVKDGVWKETGKFVIDPWSVDVSGLVAKPRTFALEEILRLPLEERIYRHRCVEAWAMTVPWTGVPLRLLLEVVEPKAEARYVRFVSFDRPDQAPGIDSQPWYPWPYFEALRLDEAMNDLTFLVTGVYGHALPKQHGAPVRLAVPWKYGYKSAKSIVRIELVAEKPPTFWNQLEPDEYGFESNVDPTVPHPRWSQASERLIGTLDTRATLPYNGYGAWVAGLYA